MLTRVQAARIQDARVQAAVTATLLFIMFSATSVHAQDLPWVVFEDLSSNSVCDVVNAENAELVVLRAAGELVLISGDDNIMTNTFMDAGGFVSYEGLPFGVIDFATDGDGFRTLWWMTLLGAVIHVDEFTGVPSVTNMTPSDFVDIPCDAEPFWDGCLENSDCDDDNQCSVDSCSGGVCIYFNAIAACDDGDGCTIFDVCISGECVGSQVDDCDSNDPPVIVIDFCGTGTTLSMIMTFAGLSLLRLRRRRFM